MTEPLDRRRALARTTSLPPPSPVAAARQPSAGAEPIASARERTLARQRAEGAVDRFLSEDNLWLSDAEEDALLEHLGATDAADFRDVLAGMSDAQLERLTDSIGDEQRAALLKLAIESGVVRETGGAVRRGAFDPPDAPRFLQNDPSLPPPLRRAVHEENLVRADRYEERYADYHQRWTTAFHAAPSMAARRRLGRPLAYEMPNHEPGRAGDDRLATEMVGDWVHRPRAAGHFAHATDRAITYAVAEDQGRAVGGSLELFVEGEVSVELKPEVGFGLSGVLKGEASVRGDGQINGSASGGAGPKLGDKHKSASVGIAVDHDGQVTGTVGLDVDPFGAELTVHSAAEGGLDGSGSVKLGGEHVKGRVGVTDRGQVEVAAVFGAKKRTSIGEVGASVAAGGRLAPCADPEVFRRALVDHGSFFDPPDELLHGVAWPDLPTQRRADLHRVLGWTEGEWSGQLALRRADTRPLLR